MNTVSESSLGQLEQREYDRNRFIVKMIQDIERAEEDLLPKHGIEKFSADLVVAIALQLRERAEDRTPKPPAVNTCEEVWNFFHTQIWPRIINFSPDTAEQDFIAGKLLGHAYQSLTQPFERKFLKVTTDGREDFLDRVEKHLL